MAWEKDVHAGNLALCRGIYEEAERFFLRAQETAATFGPGDTAWAEVKKGLAKVYLAWGRAKDAELAACEALATDEVYWGVDCEQVADDCFLVGEALRLQWDFERARPWFERTLNFREARFGTTHDTTLDVLSRMLVVYLQSENKFGLEQFQAKTYEAYQSKYPSGMWPTFLKLHELGREYQNADKMHEFQELLRVETNLLRKQLGASHKEVAGVLAMESELLKNSKRQLAAWSVNTQAQRVEKANNLSLFASDERTYKFPASQVEDAMFKLLASQPNWIMQNKRAPQDPLLGACHYYDGQAQAELRLTARITPRGPLCSVLYEWQLLNSSNMNMAKGITRETVRELDDNMSVMAPAFVLPAGFSSIMSPAASSVSWPSPQQFNEAIQNPRSAFRDAELQSCEAELNAIGLPKPYSGAFATVYKVSSGGNDYAVKCFTTPVSDQQSRYPAISEQLTRIDSPYFVDFEYQAEGMLIGGKPYPILKMTWVDGRPLLPYIHSCLSDRQRIEQLALKLLDMVKTLQAHGIAHGDFQHGNIIMVDDELRLVDYDGMFVPALAGWTSNELGHRNYQHPDRAAEHFDARLDNFSTWSIYCSLMCLSRAPHLWDLFQAGEESLLFKHDDYANPASSHAFKMLLSETDPDIKATMRFFSEIVALKPDNIPSISEAFGTIGT